MCLSVIKTLHNNNYNINKIEKHPASQKHNTDIDRQHRKRKWAIFTYSGKETRKITKLFKDMQIKIAFRTQNTIQNIIKQHPRTDKYNRSGIYHMKCLDCPLNT
jgi:hypothetical protein